MEPRSRSGVSTYLELFLLIGVATGGSALVYATAGSYAAAPQGPAISVSAATIRQGSEVAVERITVANTGSVSFSSLTVSTPSLPTSTTYCYSVSTSAAPPTSTCPTMSANPSPITIAAIVTPGGTATVQLTMVGGNVFTEGSAYAVVVTASNSAQVSLRVVALPA